MTDAGGPTVLNASEADGSTHAVDLVTRDYPMPGGIKGGTATRVRLRYEATAASTPAITASFARFEETNSYTALTLTRGGGASDGSSDSSWSVGKRAPAIRFRFQSASPLSTFKVRSIESSWRQPG